METINIKIDKQDVYDEVGKATDYTGAKLTDADSNARDRIYAEEADLNTLGRFFTEAAQTTNERLKTMLLSTSETSTGYTATLEVSVAFDKVLTPDVQKSIRSYFITFIIAEWYKLAKKDEQEEYFALAESHITNAERLLYSRMKPKAPSL